MLRAFIAALLFTAAAAGLSYAYFQQDQTYTELFDQATRAARRQIIALRDTAISWRLPKRELDVLVDGMARVYASTRQLVRNDPYTYVTAPIERGHIATVVRATGTVNPTYTVDISSQLSGRMAEVFV